MKKTYQKIVETAEKLFYKSGFGQVGVDTIRDESGCSKTTMYTHFGNKDNLISAVLAYRDGNFRQSLQGYVGDVEDAEAISKIFAWHQAWFAQPEFNGCLFVRGVAELNEQSQAIIVAHKVWLQDFIEEKISARDNAGQIAQQLMMLLEGLISMHSIHQADKVQRDGYMQSSLAIVDVLLG